MLYPSSKAPCAPAELCAPPARGLSTRCLAPAAVPLDSSAALPPNPCEPCGRAQAARQKLEVERAAEGLVRAVGSCKAVGDLPRLEGAILAARKLGAQSMHPEAYK